MPKKFSGENSKSAIARARKETAKNEKKLVEEAAKEDAYWADNDKRVQRKLNKKEEETQKRQKIFERKQQNRQAYEEELKTLTGNKTTTSTVPKVTVAQIEKKKQAELQKRKEAEEKLLQEKKKITILEDIPENLNKVDLDVEVASNVDDALKVLSLTKKLTVESLDEHPEKRVKAAYTAFEERRLKELKLSHPTFRLSQLKQILRKEWLKSEENPLNQTLKLN